MRSKRINHNHNYFIINYYSITINWHLTIILKSIIHPLIIYHNHIYHNKLILKCNKQTKNHNNHGKSTLLIVFYPIKGPLTFQPILITIQTNLQPHKSPLHLNKLQKSQLYHYLSKSRKTTIHINWMMTNWSLMKTNNSKKNFKTWTQIKMINKKCKLRFLSMTINNLIDRWLIPQSWTFI